ncbi:MAG: YbjQ family protein [Vallitaleaceae bacterium]|nr:YbjQ family protein [Vallitaleaceae bacterium]
MIVSTSFSIEGRNIKEYLGIVSAAHIMVMPGGNKGVQRGWQTGIENTTEILKQKAAELGADAIIAARFEPFGSNLCATGTAVKLD